MSTHLPLPLFAQVGYVGAMLERGTSASPLLQHSPQRLVAQHPSNAASGREPAVAAQAGSSVTCAGCGRTAASNKYWGWDAQSGAWNCPKCNSRKAPDQQRGRGSSSDSGGRRQAGSGSDGSRPRWPEMLRRAPSPTGSQLAQIGPARRPDSLARQAGACEAQEQRAQQAQQAGACEAQTQQAQQAQQAPQQEQVQQLAEVHPPGSQQQQAAAGQRLQVRSEQQAAEAQRLQAQLEQQGLRCTGCRRGWSSRRLSSRRPWSKRGARPQQVFNSSWSSTARQCSNCSSSWQRKRCAQLAASLAAAQWDSDWVLNRLACLKSV